jgi:hypothetical protein
LDASASFSLTSGLTDVYVQESPLVTRTTAVILAQPSTIPHVCRRSGVLNCLPASTFSPQSWSDPLLTEKHVAPWPPFNLGKVIVSTIIFNSLHSPSLYTSHACWGWSSTMQASSSLRTLAHAVLPKLPFHWIYTHLLYGCPNVTISVATLHSLKTFIVLLRLTSLPSMFTI